MPSFHLITPVWGEEFTNLFLDAVLPCQLAEGNLPEFAGGSDLYRIFTTSQDAERIKKSPVFGKLQKTLPTEISLIDEAVRDLNAGKMNRYDVFTLCHSRGIAGAAQPDTALVLLSADIVFSTGSLGNLRKIALSGKRMVVVGSYRVVAESFVPALKKNHSAPGSEMISISSREMVKLSLGHIHNESKTLFWNSPRLNDWPAYLFWMVEGEGVLQRGIHLSPLLINPCRRNQRLFSTSGLGIDGYDYMMRAVPDFEDVHVVEDSDEIFFTSLTSQSESHRVFKPGPMGVASWIQGHCCPYHVRFLENKIRFHCRDYSSKWGRVEEDSDGVVASILACLDLCSRFPRVQQEIDDYRHLVKKYLRPRKLGETYRGFCFIEFGPEIFAFAPVLGKVEPDWTPEETFSLWGRRGLCYRGETVEEVKGMIERARVQPLPAKRLQREEIRPPHPGAAGDTLAQEGLSSPDVFLKALLASLPHAAPFAAAHRAQLTPEFFSFLNQYIEERERKGDLAHARKMRVIEDMLLGFKGSPPLCNLHAGKGPGGETMAPGAKKEAGQEAIRRGQEKGTLLRTGDAHLGMELRRLREFLAARDCASHTSEGYQDAVASFLCGHRGKGDAVIEIGCLKGGLTSQLAWVCKKMGLPLHVVEISPENAAKTRKLLGELGLAGQATFFTGTFHQFVSAGQVKEKPLLAVVDGDHTHEGVAQDIRSLFRLPALPYAAAFHDVSLRNQGVGVDSAIEACLGLSVPFVPIGQQFDEASDSLTTWSWAPRSNPASDGHYWRVPGTEGVIIRLEDAAPWVGLLAEVEKHAARGDLAGAKALLARYGCVNGEKPEVYQKMAQLMIQEALLPAARELIQKAIELKPQAWQLHQELGKIFFIQEEWIASMEAYERAVELDPPVLIGEEIQADLARVGKALPIPNPFQERGGDLNAFEAGLLHPPGGQGKAPFQHG